MGNTVLDEDQWNTASRRTQQTCVNRCNEVRYTRGSAKAVRAGGSGIGRRAVAAPPDLDQRGAGLRRAACVLTAGAHHGVAEDGNWKSLVALDSSKPLPDAVIEAAITRVLDAEASAHADVEAARIETLLIAEHARERARRLVASSDRRIRRIRAAFSAKVTLEVAALNAEAEALGVAHELSSAEVAQVDLAVAMLAGAMTGGAP